MINLIDQETRADLRAAKRNIVLRHIIIMLLSLGVVMTASYGIGYLILNGQAEAYRQEAARYIPEKQKYADVIKEANTFNSNLATAKTIFKNEFFFSNLLIIFSKKLPANTVLDNLNTTATDLSKPIMIDIRTKTNVDADKAKLALQNTPYFKDTKIRAIKWDGTPEYPYLAQIITVVDIKAINNAYKAGEL